MFRLRVVVLVNQMKKRKQTTLPVLIACLSIVWITACSNNDDDDNNNDYDPPGNRESCAVERALWKQLGKEAFDEFTKDELATVTCLTVDSNFPGRLCDHETTLLAACINLTELELTFLGVSDLIWLAGLIQLTKLDLSQTGRNLRPPSVDGIT